MTAVWGLVEALRGGDDAPRAQAWHGWRLLVSGAALSLDDFAGLALRAIGLEPGAKLGTAAGEHGEVAAGIILTGVAAAMAADWLLPGSTRLS